MKEENVIYTQTAASASIQYAAAAAAFIAFVVFVYAGSHPDDFQRNLRTIFSCECDDEDGGGQ